MLPAESSKKGTVYLRLALNQIITICRNQCLPSFLQPEKFSKIYLIRRLCFTEDKFPFERDQIFHEFYVLHIITDIAL